MCRRFGITWQALRITPVTGSSFLGSLPVPTRSRLVPMLALRALRSRQVLSDADVPFTEVFFPVRCVLSTLTVTMDGAAIEVALAGHEGLSPVTLAFGSRSSRHTTVVQVPDSAYCMGAGAFLRELEAHPDCAGTPWPTPVFVFGGDAVHGVQRPAPD